MNTMQPVSQRILSCFATGLGLPDDYFQEARVFRSCRIYSSSAACQTPRGVPLTASLQSPACFNCELHLALTLSCKHGVWCAQDKHGKLGCARTHTEHAAQMTDVSHADNKTFMQYHLCEGPDAAACKAAIDKLLCTCSEQALEPKLHLQMLCTCMHTSTRRAGGCLP